MEAAGTGSCWAPCQHIEAVLLASVGLGTPRLFRSLSFSSLQLSSLPEASRGGGASLKGDGQVIVWDRDAFVSVQTLCLLSCSHEALGLAALVYVYVYIGSLGE